MFPLKSARSNSCKCWWRKCTNSC